LVLLFVLFLLIYVEEIGRYIAMEVEGKLIGAFSVADLQNGHPILIMRKRKRGTKVTIYKFFNTIPLKRWEEMKDEIQDFMNIHFVAPYIEYGGRNKNNSKWILIYTAKYRKAKEQGIMYDDEF